MKRAVVLSALLLSAAGYVFLQTAPPAPELASIMPGGALLYVEAPDFNALLRDWERSKVKSDWLASANYAVFTRSNLFSKLGEVYGQYGAAAGFLPDLNGILQIAGTDSALALYELRDVEFLYVSRIGSAEWMKSQLWALRDKFEQRQAGGAVFYLRTDPESKRTVAFAFANGYLFLATRDDLVAQALELLNGASIPSIAADRWYHDATAASSNRGELRLVMNLESLVKSTYFRSYWIQRNASSVRQYWAGIADVSRKRNAITENRVFLRTTEADESATPVAGDAVSRLLALVPPEAVFYRASNLGRVSEAAELIVGKLIAPQAGQVRDVRQAPWAAAPDLRAGTEADLETHIDEQPLPADAGVSDSIAAVRALAEKSGARGCLLVQSTSRALTFVQMRSVIVLDSEQDWDPNAVRGALGVAAGRLWTTSELGAAWANGMAGRHPIERLEGLGSLLFATRAHLLFLSNDAGMLGAVLDRVGAPPAPGALTYAAGFRHSREEADYERLMAALDFTGLGPNRGFVRFERPDNAPSFFSGNLGSLSRVLSAVSAMHVTAEDHGPQRVERVLYETTR